MSILTIIIVLVLSDIIIDIVYKIPITENLVEKYEIFPLNKFFLKSEYLT